MFLEVDLAIYRRLTGYPLDSTGRPLTDGAGVPTNRECIGPPDLNPYERIYDAETGTYTTVLPVLPSYGIRVPLLKGSFRGSQGLNSQAPNAIPLFDKFEPDAFKQVPVFDQNVTGRDIENIWPCVTFRMITFDFDGSVFVFHDPFKHPDTTSEPVQILNRAGDVVQEGFSKNVVRPHPEAWKMTYAITAYAKSTVEMGLICAEISRLFPSRGAVNVTFASGEVHACDMLLQRTETLDEGGDQVLMTRGPEQERSLAKAFIFVVEGYADNTVNKFGVRDTRSVVAVRERILELDRIMGDLAIEESNEDLNLGELKPITA